MTANPSPTQNQAKRLLHELRLGFLEELPERLDDIESLVLNLEQDQASSNNAHPVYDELYRHIHSLKGSAGTHGIPVISLISHQFEDVLTDIGTGLKTTPIFIDIFLTYVDLIRSATTLAHDENADFKPIKSELEAIRKKLKHGKKLVLIIEGSSFMVNLYKDSLNSLPVEISVIDDGLEALGWLLREKYDAVIMGAETKSLNGKALLYALRAAGGINRDVMAIIVTSSQQTQFADTLGPDAVLTKNKQLSEQLHKVISPLFNS